ncbi:chemotaxis protein CheX [Bacillus sp. 2205SS5-2]|uniref:chemotaxis protein CheX n=1 Tax=Bacillus sp. 2205SS5-2 TaxID=3109031 RepID=UPI003007379F
MSSEAVTHILNSTTQAIKTVVPFEISIEKPTLFKEINIHTELGVIVGITGDLKGTLYLTTLKQTSNFIAEKMYGMSLDGDMLVSFQGELANMISGNMSRIVYEKGIEIDITPPTIVEGKVVPAKHKIALEVNAVVGDFGKMKIVLALND